VPKKHIPIIHIIGLPGSGKTELSTRLKRSLKVPVYRIGSYRARFPQTAIGEADAWVDLFKDLSCRGWKGCILETTGMNARETFLRTALPRSRIVTIKLAASLKTLYRRIGQKKKADQGGEWLFSASFYDKYQFARKLFRPFKKIPADLFINTDRMRAAQVHRLARQELEILCTTDHDDGGSGNGGENSAPEKKPIPLCKIRFGAKKKQASADICSSDIHKLADRISEIRKLAERYGVFTNDRELLACPCGLTEDVACDGHLFTYRKGKEYTETGLSFMKASKNIFCCPACKRKLRVKWL
jgi:hypothetical protein